jgi:putative ABC transport system permease protein
VGNLLNDVRFYLRGFARRPLFAVVVVVTLALGLSVNAAIFSIYHQVLLRELPVAKPHELVNFVGPGPKQGNTSCSNIGTCDEIFSYPMFRELERFDGPFAGIAAHRDFDANLAIDGETQVGEGLLVSGSYFPLLGLNAAAGRLLDRNDDSVDGEASVVVLAFAYWQAAFGGDPSVVGRELVVNGKPLTVVGIAPSGFSGTAAFPKPQVFVPITFRWRDSPNAFPNHTDRKSYWAYLFARLKPGVSLEQAAAQINVPYRAIVNDVDAPLVVDFSEQQMREFRARTVTLEPGARGQSMLDFYARAPLTILFVSTGIVLLIASVNVANLLLARGSTRVGEIAVRSSLGASRTRLLALLLIEVLLLAAGAAAVSLPVTLLALRGITSLLPGFAVNTFDTGLSAAAVAMTFALAVVSALVFGLIPALKLMQVEASPTAQFQGVRATGGKNAARFRTSLTTAQIALSMALLVLGGWFVQSLANVTRVDLGFRAESLTVFSIAPDRNGYTPPRSAALFERLEQDLAQVPGVTSVATAAVPLLADSNWNYGVEVEGYAAAPGENTSVAVNYVNQDFFRTLEMPLIAGSGFERGQGDQPKVAIVNERFIERFGLDAATALGKRISTGTDGPVEAAIVGIVRDAKYSDVRDDPPPQLFLPRSDAPFLGAIAFYLRTANPSLELRRSVEQVLARHDRNLPLMNFRAMIDQAEENVFLDRFMSTLAAALAVIATILASIGIYGVLSYGVAQRLREIGLRIALGAAPQNVRRMVLKQVAWMAAIGVVVGVSLALLIGQVGRALLYGLSPTDPLVPTAAVLALLAVVLAAAYWPARRAALVDPVTALRGD